LTYRCIALGKFQLRSEFKLGFHLSKRAGRYTEEVMKLAGGIACRAFSYVGRIDTTDLRTCAVNPYNSSLGKREVARYTITASFIASCHANKS
jgi:hypothetical protein